ncbi:MAG TPA: hypothetical protein VLV54_16560 [Thermoanaerobaculia bacterium]|nr:hypothetical protein [Thermoanaerobaculia bacterium]
MAKHLTVLMCALILTGFAALAAAEPASSNSAAQPVHPVFLSQGVCQLTALSSVLVSAPVGESECQGWLYGSCDRRADCTGFYCPLGELKTCYGGTGSGCQGTCTCVP